MDNRAASKFTIFSLFSCNISYSLTILISLESGTSENISSLVFHRQRRTRQVEKQSFTRRQNSSGPRSSKQHHLASSLTL